MLIKSGLAIRGSEALASPEIYEAKASFPKSTAFRPEPIAPDRSNKLPIEVDLITLPLIGSALLLLRLKQYLD